MRDNELSTWDRQKYEKALESADITATKARKERDSAISQYNEKAKTVKDLEEKLSEKNKEIRQAQSELKAASSSQKDSDLIIYSLRTQLDDAKKKIEQENVRANQEEMGKKQAIICNEQLQENLKAKEKALQTSYKNIEELNAKLSDAQNTLRAVSKARDTAIAELKKAQEKAKADVAEIQKLDKESDAIFASWEEKKKELKAAEDEIALLKTNPAGNTTQGITNTQIGLAEIEMKAVDHKIEQQTNTYKPSNMFKFSNFSLGFAAGSLAMKLVLEKLATSSNAMPFVLSNQVQICVYVSAGLLTGAAAFYATKSQEQFTPAKA
jgi:chromosome segregation ATPase